MGKELRVIRVIERWCGQPPAQGTDTLLELWEQHGPSGVPFEMEGAELLIRELDAEFPRHRLRPVDVLEMTFDSLVDGLPDVVAKATRSFRARTAADAAPAAKASQGPVTVTLTDETIERLARRIAELLRPKPSTPSTRARKRQR